MKQYLLLLCATFLCITTFAQLPKAVLSESFDEPDALDSKVVQCPNGNTFLFSFTAKDGIDVVVFDKSRKTNRYAKAYRRRPMGHAYHEEKQGLCHLRDK